MKSVRDEIRFAESVFGGDSISYIRQTIEDRVVERFAPEDFPTLSEHTRSGRIGEAENASERDEIEQEWGGNAEEVGSSVSSAERRISKATTEYFRCGLFYRAVRLVDSLCSTVRDSI